MNHSEVVSLLAVKLNISKAQAGRLLKAQLESSKSSLLASGVCYFPGLGRIEVVAAARHRRFIPIRGRSGFFIVPKRLRALFVQDSELDFKAPTGS